MSKSKNIDTMKTQVEEEDDHRKEDETVTVGDVKKINSKEFLCHICGITFSRKEAMTKHIRVHDGYRYICRIDMCYTFFTTKKALKDHQFSHTGEYPYTCEYCGKRFGRASTLTTHLDTHTDEKKHVCNVCQRAFAQRPGLIQHLQSHTRKYFYCTYCGFKTVWKGSLKIHLSKCLKKREFDDTSMLPSDSSIQSL